MNRLQSTALKRKSLLKKIASPMPYLKEADDDHLSRDEMGQYLVYDDVYIVCENNSYGVYRNDDDSLTDTVTISQNEAGIDTEDRIIKLKKYIANMK